MPLNLFFGLFNTLNLSVSGENSNFLHPPVCIKNKKEAASTSGVGETLRTEMLPHRIRLSTIREKANSHIHLKYVQQDFVECHRLIEEQLRLCSGQSEYPLYIKGLILRQQGRIDESLLSFQAALCLNPTNVNNLKQVGRSLYLLGKHKMALEVFEEAEHMTSEDREVWHSKGMCNLYLKQHDLAIECFEMANQIQPHETSYIQLGRLYRLLGKDEKALEVYLDALDSNSESPELLTTVGLLYLKLKNNSKAFQFLGNSLTYDPKNAKTILAAGSIIQDNKDDNVALTKYRVACVQTPNSAQLWNNIGMCFFGKGKYVAAVACLKKATYLSPFEWILSYNLGVVHLASGQFSSAFQCFSTAINLQPTYSKAYGYLAVALSKLEDFENSCAAYEKANELGADPVTLLNFAITLYTHDEIVRAREVFQKYEAMCEKAPEALEADSEISRQASLLKMAIR